MTRATLLSLSVLGAALFALFAAFPDLDLVVSRFFYDAEEGVWTLAVNYGFLRFGGMYLPWLIAAPAIAALVLRLAIPGFRRIMSARAALFLVATWAAGPGLIVHFGFKDVWHRSRPVNVTEFGGTQRYTPWYVIGGDCRRSCAFVSGEAAAAAWTFAPASLLPPAWRTLAYMGVMVFTTSASAFRVAFGAHFATDVIGGALISFLVIWLARLALFRRRGADPQDDAVEARMERIAQAIRLRGRRNSGTRP